MRFPMRLSIRSILPILAIGATLPILGWTASSDSLTLQSESRLWVEGTSSLKNWSCNAADVRASIEGSSNAVAQVTAGEKGVRTVSVTVPADKIDCSNGTMNDHMRKALKVTEFPTIAFRLDSYDVVRGADATTGTLKGTLTLGGVQKHIAIPATGRNEKGSLRVTGAYELRMSDYDLTPPSLMFGRIKVRDAVNVQFDLVLKS